MTARMSWTGPICSGTALTRDEIRRWRAGQVPYQPDWGDDWLVGQIVDDLAVMPSLVGYNEIGQLRLLLAEVATGSLRVVQAGDCAEDPADCVPDRLRAKVDLLDAMAETMRITSGRPALRVGRIAGQFAKPRTAATERVGDLEVPVYQGHLVNDPRLDRQARRADPLRLLAGYEAASQAVAYLGTASEPRARVWTSHEALLLDYELPLVRRTPEGNLILTSTHWPWIGDRTRHPDGAHVRLLAAVGNPVACKVGPDTTVDELRGLCARLDPGRTPGRLTLVARMGAELVAQRLPRLVTAVRAAGHPVIWLCDPMHGNTVRRPSGGKTRRVSAVIEELSRFQSIVGNTGAVAGGLHLEVTPEPVEECVSDASRPGHGWPRGPYTSLCDPRLNSRQALLVTECWYR